MTRPTSNCYQASNYILAPGPAKTRLRQFSDLWWLSVPHSRQIWRSHDLVRSLGLVLLSCMERFEANSASWSAIGEHGFFLSLGRDWFLMLQGRLRFPHLRFRFALSFDFPPPHVLVENGSMVVWPSGVLNSCGCLSMYFVTMLDGVGWLANIPIEC